VSQLFDSLRREVTLPARTKAIRTAHGDAVLATLGYPRIKERRASPAAIALGLLTLALAAVSAGWSVYDRSAPARVEPRNVDALVNLAMSLRAAGKFDLAKETLVKAVAIAPGNAAAHYNLGQLYDQTDEPARAVEHYRTFLETAGAEHASRASAVRARIAVLSRTPE